MSVKKVVFIALVVFPLIQGSSTSFINVGLIRSKKKSYNSIGKPFGLSLLYLEIFCTSPLNS